MAPVSHSPTSLSLKGRALQLLAQREQSRAELRRKLLPYAALEIAAVADGEAAQAASVRRSPDDPLGTPSGGRHPAPTVVRRPTVRQAAASPGAVARVDALLDWLEANHHLSEARFVESRVHTRAARYGLLRIRQELAQHHVGLPDEAARVLQDSELARAVAVWQRKFGAAPPDAATRARQMRFMAGRGFSAEVVRRTVPAPDRGAVPADHPDDDRNGGDDLEANAQPDE